LARFPERRGSNLGSGRFEKIANPWQQRRCGESFEGFQPELLSWRRRLCGWKENEDHLPVSRAGVEEIPKWEKKFDEWFGETTVYRAFQVHSREPQETLVSITNESCLNPSDFIPRFKSVSVVAVNKKEAVLSSRRGERRPC
jgi:hypothetical protein